MYERGTLTFHADGRVAAGTPGDWRLQLGYDALGRLIRVQKPWTTLDDHRDARLYYDGVRRIAEVFKDPIEGPPTGLGGPPTPMGYTTYTEREYVWGAGYIDECLWQVTKPGGVLHVLQDASKDVVALLDETGAVARQYTLDPYGQVLSEEVFGTPAHNRLGHHGLFFDRLDADAPGIELAAGARGLYHNRNRTYDPRTGRFTTGDPNGTGLPVVSHLAHHGQLSVLTDHSFDIHTLFEDGMSVYRAVQSNPLSRHDQLGLFADLFLPGPGDMISAALEAVVSEYSANLDWDVHWAGDWEYSDELHSRLDSSWVDMAMLRGVYGAFALGIPGTGIEFNPLDAVAKVSTGRFGQRMIRVGGRVGRFSARIPGKVPRGNYYVNAFKHPHHLHKFVIFPDRAIKRQVKIRPRGGSSADIAAANKRFNKPGKYDWSDELGVPHTWHHDNVRGRMYLVPRDLHEAVRPHTGGARVWYE